MHTTHCSPCCSLRLCGTRGSPSTGRKSDWLPVVWLWDVTASLFSS